MKKIDLQKWERTQAYQFFSQVDCPFYSVTTTIDVTAVKQFAKDNNLSFYYTMVWLVSKAVNCVEEFNMRIVNNEVIQYQQTYPSFTVLLPNQNQFSIITFNTLPDCKEFCEQAQHKAQTQTAFLDTATQSDQLIYISCTPWFDFTSLTNERNFDKDDCIPRIAWGKYYEQDGKLLVHMSIEVNHRLVDGLHIGKFVQALDNNISKLCNK